MNEMRTLPQMKKVVKVYVGEVNGPLTASKQGIVAIYDRGYSMKEFLEKLRDCDVTVDNHIKNEVVLAMLEDEGFTFPQVQKNFFSIDAYSVYYKIVIDQNDNVIIHRWNFYPHSDLIIKTELED